MNFIVSFTALLLALPTFAAVPQKKAAPVVPKILSGTGATYGGLAGSGFTLMDLRRTADKNIERLVFDIGDKEGAAMRGWPGYYHAELKDNPQRLVIDFAQMPGSRLDQAALNNRLKGSIAVKNTVMSLEPVDNTLNLTMDLKKNTKVRVYQVMGKNTTSKVVVDLITE
ncbi:hypothetical protein [Bdellovibrio sp. NC01]|uniref:hypothetical protein n=1 Tax=Bdellovibrio sp. NC01 TaxID=2220073 RepID=UPI001157AA53|nr:hypothetical protein [Bdellovibrio sp. NC01]QDK38937.1 hypothetical protein DOE51_15755 [Bdellovibrio sp. NC01]